MLKLSYKMKMIRDTLSIFALLLYIIFGFLLTYRLVCGYFLLYGNSSSHLLLALLICIMSLILALAATDIISGFFHFVFDNFGNTNTPILGLFVFAFREHHYDQLAMTKHNFYELTGHSAMLCLITMIPAYFFLFPDNFYRQLLLCYLLFFNFAGLLTNYIHYLAHVPNPPTYAKILQKMRLIVSPEHHQIHHTYPYTSNYCINTGWFNPLFNKITFITKNRKKI